MAELATKAGKTIPEKKKAKSQGTLQRVSRYTGMKLISLIVTVTIGIYLTIIIANMGGKVDDIRKGQISESISMAKSMDPEFRALPTALRQEILQNTIALEESRLGLDRPFLLRSFNYLWSALSLNLGRAEQLTSDSGSRYVRNIILERLPATLLLFATAQLLLFFITVFFALHLSRRYGSRLDKMIVGLAPTSAAPSWFYGIFLLLLFAGVWGILPFGGMVSAPPPPTKVAYALSLMRHLILPVMAIVVSSFFLTVYSWRTFFLIYSSEDYVEMAKAKGLSSMAIERRYVLRPTLPTIVTSFALTLISMWMGSVTLETIFNWPGLGQLLYQAVQRVDTPVVVGSNVVFAYLLAITVFLLDILYALIDPRVKVGAGGGS